MLQLRFELSYRNSPFWLFDEKDRFLCNGLSLIETDEEVAPVLNELQELYEGMFIETEQVLEFVGFLESWKEEYFYELMGRIIYMIKAKVYGRYLFQVRSNENIW